MLSESTGASLLDEIKHKEMKKYNSRDVFTLNSEIKFIEYKIEESKRNAENGITTEIALNFALLKAYKDRLVRINKTYHFDRFCKIQNAYLNKENVKDSLSLDEVEYMKTCTTLIERYLSKYKHLNLSDRNPPLDFYVQLLTLEDCGTILCGDEFVDLKKDRIYFLKKADVSHLINKGKVKII